MCKKISVAAVDLGASGGKTGKFSFDGETIAFDEVFDFPNKPVRVANTLYWDLFALYRSALDGIARHNTASDPVGSVAFDSWGATYGLLDRWGRLAQPVFHYRDARTDHALEKLYARISKRDVFRLTGCQCAPSYTLAQLYASVLSGDPALQTADKLLFLPDLMRYFLSGETYTERTIAGTSALMRPAQDQFSEELLNALSIPKGLFQRLINAGETQGTILPDITEETGLTRCKVVATTGHDTAAAVCAIPNFGSGKLYVSIGTNVNMGVEVDAPCVSDACFAYGLKNTGGALGKILLYKDFAAFWIINELRAAFAQKGYAYSFEQIEQMARDSGHPDAYIDLEDAFLNQEQRLMDEKIDACLGATGQPPLMNHGAYFMCAFQSIALKIAYTAQHIRQALGETLTEICVVSGGCRNKLQNQLIADALGLPLKAGLPYASLAGNALTQLHALGEIDTLAQMRAVSAKAFPMEDYTPRQNRDWQAELRKATARGILKS